MRRPRTTVFSSLVFSGVFDQVTDKQDPLKTKNSLHWQHRSMVSRITHAACVYYSVLRGLWKDALAYSHVIITCHVVDTEACSEGLPAVSSEPGLGHATGPNFRLTCWTALFALVVLQNKLDCSESQASALFCYFAVLEFYSRTQRCDTRRLQLPYVYCISLLAMWGKGSWKCCCEHIVVDVKHTRRPSVPAFYPCDHAACF